MALRLCESCSRHVRDTETSCPFCEVVLPPAAPIAIAPVSHLSRAARVALAATVLVGCRDEAKPVTEQPKVVADTSAPQEDTQPATHVVEEDTAPPAPAPSPSPSPSPQVKVKPPPAPTPTATYNPNLKKPYGAPPADGLLT